MENAGGVFSKRNRIYFLSSLESRDRRAQLPVRHPEGESCPGRESRPVDLRRRAIRVVDSITVRGHIRRLRVPIPGIHLNVQFPGELHEQETGAVYPKSPALEPGPVVYARP